jgi:hypothetical protein
MAFQFVFEPGVAVSEEEIVTGLVVSGTDVGFEV